MFKNLDVFKISHAMAVHAATRQSAIAQNIANADTPGFQAREVASFKEFLRPQQRNSSAAALRATRDRHLNGHSSANKPAVFQAEVQGSAPNGNSVSLEEEMLKAVEVQRQHERALSIYKSSLGVLRTTLGRR